MAGDVELLEAVATEDTGMSRGILRVLALSALSGAAWLTVHTAFGQSASTGDTAQMIRIPGGAYSIGSDQGRER